MVESKLELQLASKRPKTQMPSYGQWSHPHKTFAFRRLPPLWVGLLWVLWTSLAVYFTESVSGWLKVCSGLFDIPVCSKELQPCFSVPLASHFLLYVVSPWQRQTTNLIGGGHSTYSFRAISSSRHLLAVNAENLADSFPFCCACATLFYSSCFTPNVSLYLFLWSILLP